MQRVSRDPLTQFQFSRMLLFYFLIKWCTSHLTSVRTKVCYYELTPDFLQLWPVFPLMSFCARIESRIPHWKFLGLSLLWHGPEDVYSLGQVLWRMPTTEGGWFGHDAPASWVLGKMTTEMKGPCCNILSGGTCHGKILSCHQAEHFLTLFVW